MATKKTGITLAAEGEKEFRKAITNINSDMKVMSTELKKVTAEYAENDKSVEALTAKDKVLTDQYEKQQEKIRTLAQALANAKENYADNTVKVNKWQASLNTAEANLAKMDTEIRKNKKALEEAKNPTVKESEAIKEVGESAEKASPKVVEMGDIIKANLVSDVIVGGARKLKNGIVELGKETIGFSVDTQKAMNTFRAQTGMSEESADRFKKAIENVYSDNFGEDVKDISSTMAMITEQIGQVSESWETDDLTSFTESLYELRDTFGIEMPDSIRAANTMMSIFGIDGKDSLSLIASGMQNGLNFSDELLDNIHEYSVQFNKLGLDANDMFTIFQKGTNEGAFNLDKIGDAVKEFSIRAIDGSKTTEDGFKRIGLNADEMAKKFADGGDAARDAYNQTIEALKNMDDPISQSTAGVDLFGTMWEDLGPNVITNIGGINGQLYDTENALDGINNVKYNDIGSALQGLSREVQVSVSDKLNDTLLPLLQKLIVFIHENGDSIASGISKVVTAMAAVIAFVTKNWQIIVGVIASLGTMLTMLKIKTIELNIVMKANPVMAIISLIIGLITWLGTLYATNEDFRNKINAIFTSIGNAFHAVVDGIITFFTQTIPDTFNAVIGFVQNNWQGLLLLIVNPFAGAFKLLYDNCEGFRNFVNGFMSNVVDAVTTGFDGAINFITSLPGRAIEWGRDFIQGLVDGIKSAIGWVEDAVSSVADKIKSFLHFSVPDEGPLTDYETWMPDFMEGMANGISASKRKVEQAVKGVASGIRMNMSMPNVQQNVNVSNGASGIVDAVQNGLNGMQIEATIQLGNKKFAKVAAPLVVKEISHTMGGKNGMKGVTAWDIR